MWPEVGETEATSHADMFPPLFLPDRLAPGQVEHGHQLLLERPRHHAVDDEVDGAVDDEGEVLDGGQSEHPAGVDWQ